MKPIETVQDVYASVDELVADLNSIEMSQFAGMLYTLIHDTVWTTGSEVLEELQAVITENLSICGDTLSPLVKQKAEVILSAIGQIMDFSRQSSTIHYAPRRSGFSTKVLKKKKPC